MRGSDSTLRVTKKKAYWEKQPLKTNPECLMRQEGWENQSKSREKICARDEFEEPKQSFWKIWVTFDHKCVERERNKDFLI